MDEVQGGDEGGDGHNFMVDDPCFAQTATTDFTLPEKLRHFMGVA